MSEQNNRGEVSEPKLTSNLPEPPVIEPPRAAPSRFRLLPITLSMACLMLLVKATDLYKGGAAISEMLNVSEAQAAEEPKEEMKEEETAKEEMADEDKDKEEASEDGDSPDDVKLAKLKNEPGLAPNERKHEFSQIEIDILQSLAERREEIEKHARQVELREKLLQATELRINDKINEIKSIQAEVQDLLKEYSKEEKKKVQGLVKIYENMKPKEAAQIFDELDMQILLQVVDRMSARKVAPVLSYMDPIKAKLVTEQLAQFRRLQDISRKISTE